LDSYLRRVEFVIYDSTFDIAATVLLPTRRASGNFGLYAEADGVILLKKGYTETPIFFVPYERTFRAEDLLLREGTSIVYDSSSESGTVLYHYTPDYANDFWFGPGVFIGRGTYSVSYRLKLEETPPSSPISVAVVGWPTVAQVEMKGSTSLWFVPEITFQAERQEILLSSSLQEEDFAQKNSYQTFVLQFTVEKPSGFEFVGLSVPNATRIYLDFILLQQVVP
jgi:hypothetical protein